MSSPKNRQRFCVKRCGRQTYRDDGVCFACFRGAPPPVPDVETIQSADLIALVRAGISELRRRRELEDEILRELAAEVAARVKEPERAGLSAVRPINGG